MANVRLIFQGTLSSGTDDAELQCYLNSDNELFIEIDNKSFPPSFICFDKSTSIRLAKTIRTEINKM